jgi:hypothetical protein
MKALPLIVLASSMQLVIACPISGATIGPVSKLYLSDGVTSGYTIQGADVSQFSLNRSGEYAIAVGNTIRTVGLSNNGLGSEYTLTGSPTGLEFTNTIPGTQLFDGTRDATHNYTIDFNTGNVFRTDLDWSNPVLLFDFGTVRSTGITYDATNNSLWLLDYDFGTIYNVTLSGSILSSFAGPGGHIGGLALDPADNTLWMIQSTNSGLYYQYTKTGTFLGSVDYSSSSPISINTATWGAEFAYVPVVAPSPAPEPSGLALIGIASAVLGSYHWRRWSR